MDIRELRIGNLIKQKSDSLSTISFPDDILDVDLGFFYEIQTNCDFDSFEPIPLTEEWLKRAGFIWSIFHQAYHKEGFPYGIEQVSSDLYLMRSFRGVGNFTVPLKYVHQLQNLVFALTGTELEFTE